MKNKTWLFPLLLLPALLVAGLVVGERQAVAQTALEAIEVAPQDEQIFGSELMTLGERWGYRYRMWRAGSEEERQGIRNEHRERMLERAREQNIYLPEEVPAQPGRGQRGKETPGEGIGKETPPGRALGRDPETHPGRGLGPDGEGPPGGRGGQPGYGR